MTYQPPHIARLQVEHKATPEGGIAVAPKSVNDVSAVLRHATERDLIVQVVGGGSHSGFGRPVTPDILMSTVNLSDIEVWEPDDLTILVGAGASVRDVERRLGTRNQSLVMSEHPGPSTIGGAVAAGVSSLRRGRLFATRERLLETTVVTGDGRIVRSGGRVVKNVSGYDLHRLAFGAFGSTGVIVSVCLKLWPKPAAAMTVTVDDPVRVSEVIRPLAVLQTASSIMVFLAGTHEEIEAQAARLGGEATNGHDWPMDPTDHWQWSLRVPPALIGDAVMRLPADWEYLAIHGVGDIRCASGHHAGHESLRGWAESVGGALVMTKGDSRIVDPWGAVPVGLDLQRRLIAEFDPSRVINPGRLPGGV